VPLGDLTLRELFDQTAARTPAPGGGAAAAVTGATAAALVEMAAAFAHERNPDGGFDRLGRQAAALRVRLLELADEDLVAFAPVLDALALDRTDASRSAAVSAALSSAAEPPLLIATVSAEVAELAAAVISAPGNDHLRGDATAAVLLAEAATRAAARLVELNLAGSREDPRLTAAAEHANHARAARARTLPA
jgi:formiminotetrahydrofolate cyclodeaminase